MATRVELGSLMQSEDLAKALYSLIQDPTSSASHHVQAKAILVHTFLVYAYPQDACSQHISSIAAQASSWVSKQIACRMHCLSSLKCFKAVSWDFRGRIPNA